MALLCDNLRTFYRRTVRVVFALCAAWLFVSNLLLRNYVDVGEHSWLTANKAPVQCLIFCLACFLCLRCRPALRCPESFPRRIRFALVLFAVLLASIWLKSTWLPPVFDAWETQNAARMLHQGVYTPFEPGKYISFYPHQSGLVLLHWLLQFLAPEDTKLFLCLNILSYGVILLCLGSLSKAIGMGEWGALAVTLVGVLFYPLALYTVFVYGTLLGLALSLVGLRMVIGFCENGRTLQELAGAVLLGLAIAVKQNYQIFLIGALLYTLYSALGRRKHCWWCAGLLCVSFVAASKLPVLLLEHMTGRSLQRGLPHMGWVCMGLQDSPDRGPGWYNDYIRNIYDAADGDFAAQQALIQTDLREILSHFRQHPLSALRFFIRKNATQWNDPTFQGLWFYPALAKFNDAELPFLAGKLCSEGCQSLLGKLGSCFTTLVYGGLILWAWVPSPKKRHSVEDLLAVILVGGFLFHTLWEAKAQYTMPYFVLVLPLAVQGYLRLKRLPAQKAEAFALWNTPVGKLRYALPVLLLTAALLLFLFAR